MKHKNSVLLLLGTAVTATMYGLNRLQYSVCTVKNELGNTQNQYYEWRFGKVKFTHSGKGSPLLLIHDLSVGSSSYEFHQLTDALSKEHEVYTVDLLGYGLSDKPNMTYTNYLYVQLLSDFIKNIIGRKTNIIATGDSAFISINLAHNEPETVGKMIFINPQNLFQCNQAPSQHTKLLKMLLDLPVLGTFIYNTLTSRLQFEKEFRSNYYYREEAVKEEDINSYLEASHLPDYHSKYSFACHTCKYMNANIIHALKEIDNSICILYGEEKEMQTIVENYIYYNSSIESAPLHHVKHLPQLEAPKEVLKQLDIYLNS